MKARFLIIAAFFLLSTASFAQIKSNDPRAALFAREAAAKLRLSEYEYIKIRNLVQAKFQELDEAAARYKDDQPMYNEAVAKIESRYDEQIIAALPENNQTAYMTLKASIVEAASVQANAKK